MPQGYSDLKKALYVYIMMCKLLTYDEEFLAVGQKGLIAAKHKSMSYISNISLANNQIVCYEFCYIFNYFLNKLNIDSKIFGTTTYGREYTPIDSEYGSGHIFLKFLCGKVLVNADSLRSILSSDLFLAKLNMELKGLTCDDEQMKKELMENFDEVYSFIIKNELGAVNKVNESDNDDDFNEALKQFTVLTSQIKPVSIKDKIDILIDKVNSSRLTKIDAISYIILLKEQLFTEQEQDNICISFVRENINMFSARTAVIIYLEYPELDGSIYERYFMYYPGFKLIPTSRSELQIRFNERKLEYISNFRLVIPGVHQKEKRI